MKVIHEENLVAIHINGFKDILKRHKLRNYTCTKLNTKKIGLQRIELECLKY